MSFRISSKNLKNAFRFVKPISFYFYKVGERMINHQVTGQILTVLNVFHVSHRVRRF